MIESYIYDILDILIFRIYCQSFIEFYLVYTTYIVLVISRNYERNDQIIDWIITHYSYFKETASETFAITNNLVSSFILQIIDSFLFERSESSRTREVKSESTCTYDNLQTREYMYLR